MLPTGTNAPCNFECNRQSASVPFLRFSVARRVNGVAAFTDTGTRSCRIRLKLCRRYPLDPCAMPMKFGKNRPKDKKVFGTMYFPGQGRYAAALALPRPAPCWLASYRGAFPGLPVDENLKVVGFAPNFAGGTPWTHGPRP